jgi:prepilin-type N-terminal cleavage/methylation domain-containing protein
MLLNNANYRISNANYRRLSLQYLRMSAFRDNGFTLVETLISLAILAMVVTATFTIFRSVSKSWQKGDVRTEVYNNARSAIGRINSEISQAVFNKNILCKFIGTQDSIKFISFVSGASGVFEIAEIEYWYDENRRSIMRNQDLDPDYDFSTYDNSDVLSSDIIEVEFLYYDGLVWNTAWDSDTMQDKESALPKAVKIKIKAMDKKGKEGEVFEVVARIKTA